MRGIWRPGTWLRRSQREGSAAGAAAALAARTPFWMVGVMLATVGASVLSPLGQASPAEARNGVPFSGMATVGALFTTANGHLGPHFCSASVVSSSAGDLLITAAHCMAGRPLGPAAGVVFAPGYHDGTFPYGIWTVRATYVDSAWLKSQNPDDDVAFLAAGRPGTSVQRRTGAESLVTGAAPQVVQVVGYPDGSGQPVTCTAPADSFDGGRQYVFGCGNYPNGTSGGPFLAADGAVIGVIGGYQQGGDTPEVSYSARFSAAIRDLYQTAVAASGG